MPGSISPEAARLSRAFMDISRSLRSFRRWPGTSSHCRSATSIYPRIRNASPRDTDFRDVATNQSQYENSALKSGTMHSRGMRYASYGRILVIDRKAGVKDLLLELHDLP